MFWQVSVIKSTKGWITWRWSRTHIYEVWFKDINNSPRWTQVFSWISSVYSSFQIFKNEISLKMKFAYLLKLRSVRWILDCICWNLLELTKNSGYMLIWAMGYNIDYSTMSDKSSYSAVDPGNEHHSDQLIHANRNPKYGQHSYFLTTKPVYIYIYICIYIYIYIYIDR